jgi:hypothetical protein
LKKFLWQFFLHAFLYPIVAAYTLSWVFPVLKPYLRTPLFLVSLGLALVCIYLLRKRSVRDCLDALWYCIIQARHVKQAVVLYRELDIARKSPSARGQNDTDPWYCISQAGQVRRALELYEELDKARKAADAGGQADNDTWYCITQAERIKQVVERGAELEKAVKAFVAGHLVDGLLFSIRVGLTITDVDAALRRLRNHVDMPGLPDQETAKIAAELSLAQLTSKWGDEIICSCSLVLSSLAMGSPAENTKTWLAIVSSLTRELSHVRTSAIKVSERAILESCVHLNEYLWQLERFDPDVKLLEIQKALHELLISLIHPWDLGVECCLPLIEAIPTMKSSRDNLNKAMNWASAMFRENPLLLANTLSRCLEGLKHEICGVQQTTLARIIEVASEPACRPHFQRLFQTILAERRKDGPHNGRVWRRCDMKATITHIDSGKRWDAVSTSLGGTWAVDCEEKFDKVLGRVFMEFTNNGGPGLIEIDLCVVAPKHYENPKKGRGLIFAEMAGPHRKALLEAISGQAGSRCPASAEN